MIDTFFTQTHCDRCKKPLTNGRTLSMFNMDCICPVCKKAERERSDYEKAVAAVRAEEKKGNYNFAGIGL